MTWSFKGYQILTTGMAILVPLQLGSAWLSLAWLGVAWLGLAQLGSAWLGSDRLNLAQHCFGDFRSVSYLK